MSICISKLKNFLLDHGFSVENQEGPSLITRLQNEQGLSRPFHLGLQSLLGLPGISQDLSPVPLLQICFVLEAESSFPEELIRCCNWINKSTFFPGFLWDPASQQLFYRYGLPLQSASDLEKLPLLMRHLLMQTEAYADLLLSVSRGEVKMDQWLQETYQIRTS